MKLGAGAVLLAAALAASAALAGPPRQVRVSVDFRQSGTVDQDSIGAEGGIVIRRHGRASTRGTLGAESRTTRVRRTSGIFTLVQDGGDAMLSVQRQVPFEDVRFYQRHATGAGYLARGVAFERVGTSLRVHADVIDGDRVRLRLVPSVSYLGADGSGAIDFVDAATELVVESGAAVTIGGGNTRSEEILGRILGYGSRREQSESSIVLTAVVQ